MSAPNVSGLLSAMAERVSEILIEDLPTESGKYDAEDTALWTAAPMIEPRTADDLVFLLLIAYNNFGHLSGHCDTSDLTPEERRKEGERYSQPIERVLRAAVDLLIRDGAKVCPVMRQYYMSDYMDPRKTEDEREALRKEEPGTLDRLLAEANARVQARRGWKRRAKP
jgi:hypothetical protein